MITARMAGWDAEERETGRRAGMLVGGFSACKGLLSTICVMLMSLSGRG